MKFLAPNENAEPIAKALTHFPFVVRKFYYYFEFVHFPLAIGTTESPRNRYLLCKNNSEKTNCQKNIYYRKPFIILLLGQISCSVVSEKQNNKNMFGLFKNGDPIENFWTWFSENEKTYRNFQHNTDKYLNELLSKTKKISNGLAIELEPPKEGIINMTVSADGIIDLFPIVQQIIEKAPKINGWKFYAFRQRIPTDKAKGMILKAQDHELNPNKMKFSPIVTGDILDIIIYVNNITEENHNQVAYGCLMLVDNILGEYDCVTKVRGYDFHNMPPNADNLTDLLPLLELAQFVDYFYSRK